MAKPPIHYKKTLDYLLLEALPAFRKTYNQTWFEVVRPDQKLERRRLAKQKLAAAIKEHQEYAEQIRVLFNKAPYYQRQRIPVYFAAIKPLVKASEKLLSSSPHTVAQSKDLAPENVGTVDKPIDVQKTVDKEAKKAAEVARAKDREHRRKNTARF